MDNIYLNGSDEVRRASYTIQESAETIKKSIDYMASTMNDHERFLTDLLQQFKTIMDDKNA